MRPVKLAAAFVVGAAQRISKRRTALEAGGAGGVVYAFGPGVGKLALYVVREAPVQAHLQRVIVRVSHWRLAAESAQSGILTRVTNDRTRWRQRAKIWDAVHVVRLHRIDVAAFIQVQASRANVPHRQSSVFKQFALDVDIPLVHMRRIVDVVIHTNDLGWNRVALRERVRERGKYLEGQLVRLVEVITGGVGAGANGIVENSGAYANRGLVIFKWVKRQADSRVPVPGRGV